MNIRRELEKTEDSILHPRAVRSSETRGRIREEPPHPYRMSFQIDRDRIIHSKSFRRLKHKTQVLLHPMGDHYRTRLTHTLEVSQIARTIARALRLNEDLVEAIALGHDLGHTPFGHAGESVLNELCPGGFKHYEQSLRVVEILEKNGKGLNLTYEVKDGILKHSKGKGPIVGPGAQLPETLEGQVVRISDIIAYVNHDIDDAVRAGVITESMIPGDCKRILGERYSQRIDSMVTDVIRETINKDYESIYFSPIMLEVIEKLRDFLFKNVYEAEQMEREFVKAKKILKELYEFYENNAKIFEKDAGNFGVSEGNLKRRICDFIAGMTDEYALRKYQELFIPSRWKF